MEKNFPFKKEQTEIKCPHCEELLIKIIDTLSPLQFCYCCPKCEWWQTAWEENNAYTLHTLRSTGMR